MSHKAIKTALISVYHKDGLDEIISLLHQNQVKLISTGGTYDFIKSKGIPAVEVSELTGFPAILGGRVKTLHTTVFAGILARRENQSDMETLAQHGIETIDLVIVDLYPFEETVKSGASEQAIIEKIDIGGVSLIRAAAKNHNDTIVLGSRIEYASLTALLKTNGASSSLAERKSFAKEAFIATSNYDHAIADYFEGISTTSLRYGENPHQQGFFSGQLDKYVEKLAGKELSFNNLADVDASLQLIKELDQTAVVIIKHCNPCGVAIGNKLSEVWPRALASDPVSAFGGVIAINRTVDVATANQINELFFEVLTAPGFEPEALEILMQKKNRILIQLREMPDFSKSFKSIMGGTLSQQSDNEISKPEQWQPASKRLVGNDKTNDLVLAEIVCKHARSNAIAIVNDGQLLGLGCGLTSRVDACRHAIAKASEFGHNLKGAVLGSDAFFPFPDTVEIASASGVEYFIQPGGSVKDQLSINFCDENNLCMIFTGIRHFRH